MPTSSDCVVKTIFVFYLNLTGDVGNRLRDTDPTEIFSQARVVCLALLKKIEDGGKSLFV